VAETKEPTSQHGLLVVAIADYQHWEPLGKSRDLALALAQELESHGYNRENPARLTARDLGDDVAAWFTKSEDSDRLLLYWTGHGMRVRGKYYLIAQDSPRKEQLDRRNAIGADDLGELIANSRAEKILVFLDACYSGAGADILESEIAKILENVTEPPGRMRAVAVIASAHPQKKTPDGLFAGVIHDVLLKPSQIRRWSDYTQFLDTNSLARAINEELCRRQDVELQEVIRYRSYGFEQEFFLNPRYRPDRPAEIVEIRRKRLARADGEAHFLPASRGIEVGESGWYFSGRSRILAKLASWLREQDSGLVAVTGDPGSGKSAILGRLTTLSDAEYRSIAQQGGALAEVLPETVPDAGSIDVSVHAKGKTFEECLQAVAAGLDLSGGPFDIETLLRSVRNSGNRTTILLDALDEASSGEPARIGAMLLRPLAELPKTRVLVGTRRSPDGVAMPDNEERHARLRRLFGDQASILDLDDEPDTKNDIAAYVRTRLRDDGSRHRDDSSVDQVAEAVAEKAAGIFLYARIVSRTLQDLDTLDVQNLPESATAAFDNDLRKRFPDRASMVSGCLAALAWAEGRGLTRQVWPAVATAVGEGQPYTSQDVDWVLQHAGWHVIESGEAGQAVYRLAHQALADRYRERLPKPEANRRIALAMGQGIAGRDWLATDGYIRRHLATHARAAGELDRFLVDPGFLAVAEPANLLSALWGRHGERAQSFVDTYRAAADRLPGASPLDRLSILQLEAEAYAPVEAKAFTQLYPLAWRTHWSALASASPSVALRGHELAVTAVAVGMIDGEPIAVSGSVDNTLRVWDLRTGKARGEPLRGHELAVTAVAVGMIDGEPIAVSGSVDNTLRLWDLRTGKARGKPLRGHGDSVTALVVGMIGGKPVALSGSWDKTLRLWDLRTGKARGKPLRGHDSGVTAVAVGMIGGKPVALSGSVDNKLRLWDLRTGKARGEPLRGHESGVIAVAVAMIDGEPIAVSGSYDKTLLRWDLRTGKPRGKPFRGHEGMVSAVAVGLVGGEPICVSGSYDKTLLRWDLRTGKARGEPLRGHEREVTAVAVGLIDGEPVAVSGSWDKTLRLWDLRTGKARGEPLRAHEGFVSAVAVGMIDGEPIAVSGSWDKTLRLWDLRTGEGRGEPLRGHEDRVTAVAVGMIDGEPIAVSGSYDNTLRVWDLRSGKSVLTVPLGASPNSLAFTHCGVVVAVPAGLIHIQLADGIVNPRHRGGH